MDFDYHIIANLGTNRNKPGTLKVYNKDGQLVMQPVKALGRGSNLPSNQNNHANQLMQNADTPSGVALCQVIDAKPGDSFGDYPRVHLYKGLEGNFLAAEKAGRSEILIHGGKRVPAKNTSWFPLMPTHGCIRLAEEDQKNLIQVLKSCGSKGKITIL